LQVDGLPLTRLGVPPQEARGEVSLIGMLSGSLKQPGFAGDYALENAAWQGLEFESLRGHLKLAQAHLTFAPLLAKLAGGGTVDGGFEFDLKKERLLGLRLGFNNLALDRARVLMPPDLAQLEPTGFVSGTVQRQNEGADFWWDFRVAGDRVLLASETLHRFNLEGTVSSDTVEVRSLDAGIWGGQVEAHGRVDRLQAELELSARDLEIQKSHQVQRLASPSAGLISLQGNIEFGRRRRHGYFTLFGKDLHVRGQTLGNLGAEVAIDAEGLKIVRADLDRIGMQLDGSVSWDAGNPYQWKLQLKQTDLSFIPSSSGWLEVQPGDVIVTGHMEMAGHWNEKRPREALARFESIEIHRGTDLIVANRPVDVRFQNEAFEIRSLELKYRNGVFGVSGIWNPHGNAALTLSGQDFSVAALARLAGIHTEVPEGRLSIAGGISGVYPALEMKGDVTVQDLEFRGRKVPFLKAKCRVDPVGMAVNPLVAEFPRNKITAVGSLPFEQDGGVGSLDLQVEVASGPLDDLPVYLPEFFNTAKGWGKASLHFSGNPLYPQITGVARVHGDSIGFKGMKRPLTQVEIGVNTDKGLVRIEPMQAKLGRGVFSGFGEVDFRDGPGSLTVKLSGQKLDVSWGRIDIERASASVDVSGNLYNPVVAGHVQIPKGKVQIADDLLGKSSFNLNLPLESLRYTVYVDIPRNLWLKNSMINAETRGKFKLEGDLNDFQLDGGISTVQGWLTFQRRKFTIDNGEIKFGEQDRKFDPHIYFKSVTNIQNTQVFLVLDGRLSSIKPQLYSSPPQSEGTLLAMLTLGRSMDEVMMGTGDRISFEKEILDGLKNTYLSGLLSSTLSEAFNLDELYFDSLFDRTSGVTRSFLRIGKYIGYNIFLAYEGTLSNDGMKTYIIEYRLPRGFMLNVEVEKPRNNTRIGIKYDWKF
ncbi:MAG TPA: translocation/assembly module TamB domain-containing protein, partial [Candidatus Ozemobacteraceae bacterium]|nr:translocation/assembly module TamB domain-containing protein [Candidatus Ozemobacteraceae bacterium]